MPQNELEKTLGKVIDQKVMPGLKTIKEKLSEHDEKFKSHDEKLDMIIEAVAETKEEIVVLKEKVDDMGYTDERIETKLDATIRRQDDLSVKTDQSNRRLLRLEAKKS